MRSFDVMMDKNHKPWLLEINHSPSFDTDTPLDHKIKSSLIRDTLTLLNLSASRRNRYKWEKQAAMQTRILTGKKNKMSVEEKRIAKAEKEKQRDHFELRAGTDYRLIYPVKPR